MDIYLRVFVPACVHICIGIRIIRMYVYEDTYILHTRTCFPYICTYIHTNVYVYLYMYVHVCTYKYIHAQPTCLGIVFPMLELPGSSGTGPRCIPQACRLWPARREHQGSAPDTVVPSNGSS